LKTDPTRLGGDLWGSISRAGGYIRAPAAKLFHSRGPTTSNALSPRRVLVRGMTQVIVPDEWYDGDIWQDLVYDGAEKSFSAAGPRAWNSLPSHIRTLVARDLGLFSRHLKTNFSSSPMTFSDLFLYSRCCGNYVCFSAYFNVSF